MMSLGALLWGILPVSARQWTLQQCIDYALANNITLQKATVQKLSAEEDVYQSQAQLLPSLSASTSQNVTYRPWPQQGIVGEGFVASSVDKTYYNGSYSVNANWTVWNGNRNRNTVKLNKLTAQQAELDSATQASKLIEQIAQLYVQILYSTDAIGVNQSALATSKATEARGEEFVKNKLMSRADLAQLTAQRAQDEYNVVQAESNLKEYKRQLKQLLQITDNEEFVVVVPTATDAMALQTVPALQQVYNAALDFRPEIQSALLGIESSNVNMKIAKALSLPTVGVNVGVGTSTTSMSDNKWGRQLKNNFDVGAGVTVSIPLFDQRQKKTAVNKAALQRQNYELELKNQQTALYSTIEDYWLQAENNQSRYKAAKVSTKSAQDSYDMLTGKFKNNLINIVELMTGKDKLLAAQQAELQAKYLTILNIELLRFYQTGVLTVK